MALQNEENHENINEIFILLKQAAIDIMGKTRLTVLRNETVNAEKQIWEFYLTETKHTKNTK